MSQLTITQDGKVLTEMLDGVTMPADYRFATVNDYVHSIDRTYEDLECLCLGMACHVDKLTKQRDELQLTITNLRQQIAHLSDDLAGTKSNVTLAKKQRDDALDELSQLSKKLGGY